MAGILTRDTILTHGLQLGGNPSLNNALPGGAASLAQVFLNLLLDHVYRADDWAFLRKVTTAQADSTDYDKIPTANLPTDYGHILNLRPRSVNYGSKGLFQNPDFAELWSKKQRDSEASVSAVTSPSEFSVDEGSNAGGIPNIWVYQKPATRLTYDISYYSQPAALSSNTAPAFPDHMALVMAVASWCKDFQRDSVLFAAERLASSIVAQFRNNHTDRGRAGVQQIEMDPYSFPIVKGD